MKLTVSKEKLARILYLSAGIVQKKNTNPILGNVVLTAKKNKLNISASDLELNFKGAIDAEILEEGEITVDAKIFYDIVKELPQVDILISCSKENRIEIKTPQSKFKINGVSSDEYPNIKGLDLKGAINISASRLHEMLDKTAFAVSSDETRHNINGVCAEINEEGKNKSIRFIATDGHRLSIIDRPADGFSLEKSVIIPKKAISEVKKILEVEDEECKVLVTKDFFTVGTEEAVLSVRLVDGNFPDYRQVLPKSSKSSLTIAKDELLSAVKRVSLVTSDKNKAIKFKLKKGDLTISSSSVEHGEAIESLKIEQVGDDAEIGFSAKYLVDLLSNMTDEEKVKLELNGSESPGVFHGSEDSSYTCVVMPMRFDVS